MLTHNKVIDAPLGFILLRDGHAVPLTGVSPAELKAGAKHRVPNPHAEPVRHRQTLNALVDRLGFQGDFGDFKRSGWPAFQAFLDAQGCTHRPRFALGEQPGYDPVDVPDGCTHRVGLFPSEHGGCIDLYFVTTFGPKRRQLADRLFESGLEAPKRVFLGHGIDWRAWDTGMGFAPPEAAVLTVGGDPATAQHRAEVLFRQRGELVSYWGFLDDALVWGPVQEVTPKVYYPLGTRAGEPERVRQRSLSAIQAFRAVFDASPVGWVDVLPFNERLFVLRGHDGAWDVIWRGYRASEPPKPEDITSRSGLDLQDQPSSLRSRTQDEHALHLRQEVWEEHEAHEAEQAFYDRGGTMQQRQLTPEAEVRVAWLREQGIPVNAEYETWTGPLPEGFEAVELEGRRLAISPLVDVTSFRRMCRETGYLARRPQSNEPWERANEGVDPSLPVGVSWPDAQAWCAWRERQLGAALRLPTLAELRALRPFYSAHYERLSIGDFPWENRPPRPLGGGRWEDLGSAPSVPTAVAWSEPRFHPPKAGQEELPTGKRMISDFPPRAGWRAPLPWAEHRGLRFIDAWDAYEWCQEKNQVSGRFWEGPLGAWGAYKNAKVTFRVVLELGG
ncbi:MAG: SUMF1/EgtB/PvdO family nonheme iron enzyme [Alphaproteobacteria bacterium]|nr:SUMF1/EgtB/PvdO family nonheme iron enzyme [Alphaproteobacteria bacterium]MCB9795847.1 SUMF1/EgtB/PvdO family nonheme iron enzyme [Alphaproteobacteria bacterium]